MTREQIVALFDRRRAAYERRDATALVADYSDDCVIRSPSGGLHRGREAAERVLRAVFEALDVRLHQDALIIQGDRAAQEVTIEGKDVGMFLGLPPTGRVFRVPGAFMYWLKDGMIVREDRFYDFTSLLIQAGLLKAKAGI